MSARYLIRLDDACNTMHRGNWGRVEQILDAHGVKPIVAVIPDNQDPALKFDSPRGDFWDKIRAWDAKGWSIGLHGHTHVMHPTRVKLVLPFYRRSEFAGLTLGAQAEKIAAAWRAFLSEGIEPKIWVAPAHSFDLLTLQAVRRETSIRVVSDGIAWQAFYELDFHWIPQQLWSLAERKSGLWTVCLHPNTMDAAALSQLDVALERYQGRVTCVDDVELRKEKKTALSRLYQVYFWWRWRQAARTRGRR